MTQLSSYGAAVHRLQRKRVVPNIESLLADSALGYWPMQDLTGSSFVAKVGSNGTWQAGARVGSLSSNGRKGAITSAGGGSVAIDLSGQNVVTFEAWLLPSNAPAGARIFEYAATDWSLVTGTVLITVDGPTFTVHIGGTTFANRCSVTYPVPQSRQLTHVMFVCRRTGSGLANHDAVINGQRAVPTLTNTGSLTGNFANTTLQVCRASDNTSLFDGLIHDAVVYPGDMSSRAYLHYRAGLSTTRQTFFDVATAVVLHQYSLVPDSDISSSGFTTSPLWSKVNDPDGAEDGDYIGATNGSAVFTLTDTPSDFGSPNNAKVTLDMVVT